MHANPYRHRWLLLAGLSLVAGCHGGGVAQQDLDTPRVSAQVLTVQQQQATVYAMVPGTVVSRHRAEIASRLTGYVRSVAVQAGDRVVADQALLAIDSSDVGGQLQQAQAVFDEAQLNYQRATNLYEKGVATKMQLDSATRQYSTAKAALQMAQAAVGYADIRAPFAGVVVDKLVDPGDLATPGRPLLVLEDETTLEVQSYVPDELYAALHVGEAIPFATEEAGFTGKLISKVAAADAQTHTHLVRIAIPAGSGLMSGRYVKVNIPAGEAPRVRIPATALAERAGITGVFVVDATGRAHFRLVHTGSVNAGTAEIQSGLSPGERIVASPGASVENGTPIVATGGAV
ncbi:MAG TPA: efflux RND transporter periplasmic adaptor subunit [Gammaproteobacteria bacterium]|nr:efflux RND transporter periplasmic adaptor subunit [Gammaproteobacteria bacterium]